MKLLLIIASLMIAILSVITNLLQHAKNEGTEGNKICPPNLGSIASDNEKVAPNLRPILKKPQQIAKKKLSVQFTPLTLAIEQEKDKNSAENKIKQHLNMLRKMWARRLLKLDRPNYINRVIMNFQPSMTPRYLKSLLELNLDLDDDKMEDIRESDREVLKKHIATISKRTDDVIIVDRVSIEKEEYLTKMPTDKICLVDMRDMDVPYTDDCNKLEQFIMLNAKKDNCVVVFMKPIYGLRQQSLEKRYSCKIRHIALPLLEKPIGYAQNVKRWEYCERFPSVFEDKNPKNKSYHELILDHMALWRKIEFKPFYGYFYSLFDLAQTNAQIYSNTYLAANLPLLEAAAILGFDIQFSGRNRSGSNDEKTVFTVSELMSTLSTPPRQKRSKIMPLLHADQPYSISMPTVLQGQFELDNPSSGVFKIIRSNTLKWYEVEKAVVRRMVDNSKLGGLFGEQWCFLKSSAIAALEIEFSTSPQVVPLVRKTCKTLDANALQQWQKGTRALPPQPVMSKADWIKLIPAIEYNRPVVPAQLSKSPDCMFMLRKKNARHLLCFQVKTGVQDLSAKELAKEVAKSPFLRLLSNSTKVIRESPQQSGVDESTAALYGTPITFVYVASVHDKIKAELIEEIEQNSKASVTNQLEYLHIKPGSTTLSLPDNVEVIVLRKAGLISLFGEKNYKAILDSMAETKVMAEEEAQREALKQASFPLPKNEEDVRAEARKLYEAIKNVAGSKDFVFDELKKLFEGK